MSDTLFNKIYNEATVGVGTQHDRQGLYFLLPQAFIQINPAHSGKIVIDDNKVRINFTIQCFETGFRILKHLNDKIPFLLK